jgi:hypothetical protein
VRDLGEFALKPRENREKVMVRARMRVDASWQDVCILNVSLHGLGIQAARPPGRGSYVEIRRGTHVVIARIAWTKGHRAGLRSQDPIAIRPLLSDQTAAQPSTPGLQPAVERRRSTRPPAEAHESSRQMGRAAEFACFGVFACALGLAAYGTVEASLAKPLQQISKALE